MQPRHAGHGIDVFRCLQLDCKLSEQGGDRHDAGRDSRINAGNSSGPAAGGNNSHPCITSYAPGGSIGRIDAHLLFAYDAIEFSGLDSNFSITLEQDPAGGQDSGQVAVGIGRHGAEQRRSGFSSSVRESGRVQHWG